jgi:hypothetical protein
MGLHGTTQRLVTELENLINAEEIDLALTEAEETETKESKEEK